MKLIKQYEKELKIGSIYSESEIKEFELQSHYNLGIKHYSRENDSTIYYFERINAEVSRLFYSFRKQLSIYRQTDEVSLMRA